jgi:hypothetical protein
LIQPETAKAADDADAHASCDDAGKRRERVMRGLPTVREPDRMPKPTGPPVTGRRIVRNVAKRKDVRKSDAATHPPPPAPIANL